MSDRLALLTDRYRKAQDKVMKDRLKRQRLEAILIQIMIFLTLLIPLSVTSEFVKRTKWFITIPLAIIVITIVNRHVNKYSPHSIRNILKRKI